MGRNALLWTRTRREDSASSFVRFRLSFFHVTPRLRSRCVVCCTTVLLPLKSVIRDCLEVKGAQL